MPDIGMDLKVVGLVERERTVFGNIGGMSRLDFTCIGPAVNLAARLEKLTGRLRRTIVASEGFAGICSSGWHDCMRATSTLCSGACGAISAAPSASAAAR